MNSDTFNEEQHPQSEERVEVLEPEQNHPDQVIETTLPVVDYLFVEDDIPADIARVISHHLDEGESIFVLFRLNSNHIFTTGSGEEEKTPLWTVITGTRLSLVAVSSDGQTYVDTFDQNTAIEYQNGFSKDAIKIAGKSFNAGIWEGGKRKLFKEAVNLFPLPEYEKYLYIADMYLTKNQDVQAIPFLQKSLELVPTIKASLLLVHAFAKHNEQDQALTVLDTAMNFTEAASLIQENQLLFPDDVKMLLYLAAACEEHFYWDECINIYHTLLQKMPDFDLYYLKLGEICNAKQEYESAIDYYWEFIRMRTGSEKFTKGDFFHWDMSNLKWFSADPDVVKAYFDLGVIHEYELNDLEQAVSIYLSLLRHAPFYTDAYKHFWLVHQQLHERLHTCFQNSPISIDTFLQVYKLLIPENYGSTVTSTDISRLSHKTELAPGKKIAYLPIDYHPLNKTDRETLIHPGEHEYLRRVQKWLTNLVLEEEDNQGIEEYCEKVGESNFPGLFQIINRISTFLDIDPPKCFISRGKIGISVRNKEHPFIFIGSEHLNEDNERYFTKDELVFIIAAQAEHIKSGHLLVTGTELWKSLGTASFDGFLVALQCLPTGSFLGKIAHQFATAGLKKVYKMTSRYSGVKKILDFFDKGGSEKPSEETLDTSEDPGKGEWSKSKKPSESDSLVKEQIVEFARHAVYTADRAGLIACNHIGTACAVIFKLAGNMYDELNNIRQDGLFQVLENKDSRGNFLYFEYARRFSELIKFALSEEYFRIHSNVVVLPEERFALEDSPPQDISDYHILMNKLQILEHSLQNELLTPEEFLRKQKNVVSNSGLLSDENVALLDKLQQAFLDKILTIEEFHSKLFHLLETRYEAQDEKLKEEEKS